MRKIRIYTADKCSICKKNLVGEFYGTVLTISGFKDTKSYNCNYAFCQSCGVVICDECKVEIICRKCEKKKNKKENKFLKLCKRFFVFLITI